MASFGKLLAMMGHSTEAEAALRRAVLEDTYDAEAWYHLGKLLQDSGRKPEAEECFQKMRRALPYTDWRPPKEQK